MAGITRERIQTATLALLALSVGVAAPASAQLSTFDTGTEDWKAADLLISPFYTNPPTVLSLNDPAWSATGGNPGGNIAWTDQTPDYFTFSAPATFLGDHHGTYGGSLSFDMWVTASDGDPQPGVILVGAAQTIFYDLNPPGGDWTHVSVPLSEASWYDSDGNSLTAAQMQALLGTLQAIYVTGDGLTGTETAYLDNVSMVPEPSGLALLVVVGAVWARRRGALG
jgi:hypothetical protein